MRAELAFPLENRGDGARRRSRAAVEEVALALGIAHLLDRPTPSSRAASCSASRSARRSPGGRRWSLLDEPTSQLDPVAGDELIGLLRRLNEEWGTAVVLAEHRLERCLAAADRVIALRRRARSSATRAPASSWRGPATTRPRCRRPGARLLRAAPGCAPLPVGVKEARAAAARRAGCCLRPPSGAAPTRRRRRGAARRGRAPARDGRAPALRARRGVWHELRDGPAILRGVDLRARARASASR